METQLIAGEQNYCPLSLMQEPIALRFLVVEDDQSQWPLWESIIRANYPNAEIDWETTESGAEALLRHSFHTEKPYDLVISDVFLEGEDTGIDLWTRYGEVSDHFVFVSSMSLRNFDSLIHSTNAPNPGLPFYLQKPLSSEMCREVLKALL
ncbi:MAG: hypothetical protein J7501_04490 [Bdellovibrio sp.]|nr:hypothetical protein [Bdellovibrio sp.]